MAVRRKKSVANAEDMLISQRAAQRLMGDPEIISAFDELSDAYLGIFTKTTPKQREERELAYQGYKAVEDLRAVLQRRANSAKVRDLKDQAEGSGNG